MSTTAAKEKVRVMATARTGKAAAKQTGPDQDRVDVAKSLFGVLSPDLTLEEAREERMKQI